jgi:hypothetical protein
MMNVRFAAPILLVMQLIGCVAPAEPGGKGSPARLILDPLLTRRNPTAGVLSVRRDPASAGDECRHRIFLDGNPVADLRPNEVITIYASPGAHRLRAEETGQSCHGGNEIEAISERGRWSSFITTTASSNGALLAATAQ